MTVHYRSRGYIISKKDIRDADQLLTIYTEDFGKVKVLARAIRKIKSKLRAGADTFYLSDIEFIQGKAYKTLTDAIAIDKFKDLEKLETAILIAEAIERLVSDEEKDKEVFNLLTFALRNLDDPKIYYYFLWNLFSILGYGIDLYSCADCGKKLEPKNLKFDCEKGIICSSYGNISPDVVKILRVFDKRDLGVLKRLKINEEHFKSLDEVSRKYLSYLSLINKI